MATRLDIAAQMAMDLFYQDYAERSDFFDIDHFKFMFATQYSNMLNAAYQVERRANKQEGGFANIENSAAWLLEEQLTIQEENDRLFVKTSNPIFSFDWDSSANALQGIHSAGNAHIVYRKISLMERRYKQILPDISKVLFYLNNSTEIVFWGACKGNEVKIQYVPAVVGNDDNCLLSDNIVSEVIKATLTVMFGAKQGNVIQEADDPNKNKILPLQVNPKLTQAQQQT